MSARSKCFSQPACTSRATLGRLMASANSKNSVRTTTEEEIYLGKGRTIVDDPSKYPTKDSVGVGGWAGGEQGLQQFVAQGELEDSVKDGSDVPSGSSPKALGEGKDTIYVGKGQYIQDDARRYPSKEDAGFLTGATGGFAGGEVGLQQFLKTQTVEPAAQEVIQERQLRKDVLAAVGVTVFAAASYFVYLKLSGQPLPQLSDLPDISALTTTSTQVSSVPAATSAINPVPKISVSKEQLIVLAGAGSIVGAAVLFQKTRNTLVDAGDQLAKSSKKAAVQLLVLAAAYAVYDTLLR